MSVAESNPPNKALISAFSALIFFVIASPWMYRLTSGILGSGIALGGCPSMTGLLLHTVVFGLVVYGTMFIPWSRMF